MGTTASIIGDFVRELGGVEGSRRYLAQGVAQHLLHRAGYDFSRIAETPLEKLPAMLEARLEFVDDLGSEASARRSGNSWLIRLNAKDVLERGFSTLTPRGRFSLAHEVGHIVLADLCEHQPRLAESGISPNDESLCNMIACELLLPSVLLGNESAWSNVFADNVAGSGHLVGIRWLNAVSGLMQVSRWVLIRRLDKSSVLDRAQSAAIVGSYGVNARTGRSPDWRAYETATPSWGFIPRNIKLSKLSRLFVSGAVPHEVDADVKTWEGEINVFERTKGSDGKWNVRTMKTSGESRMFSFRGARYLLICFQWRPLHS